MRWPWQPRPETRDSFADGVVSAILATAGSTGSAAASQTGALETAAGLYGRAFAGATLNAPERIRAALTPEVRNRIGRDLIRRGAHVSVLRTDGGRLRIVPAATWDVSGNWQEATWAYRMDLAGPSGNEVVYRRSPAVIHCRYASDPERPWAGLGPLQSASLTGQLAANSELRLGQEAGMPAGAFLPYPDTGPDVDDDDDANPLAALQGDLRGSQGATLFVETMRSHGQSPGSMPQQDWKPNRFGGAVPDAMRELRGDAAFAVLDACGVPRELTDSKSGTGAREAWRRFVLGSVEPLAAMVAEELSAKLDADVQFDFFGLWAHDLAGRAQAFERLVKAGVDRSDALRLTGLLVED